MSTKLLMVPPLANQSIQSYFAFSVYRQRRPYRRRRRKFPRKDNYRDGSRKTSEGIYSSSNYYRKATPTRSDSRKENVGYSSSWYNGDYQEDFHNTYKYQQSYEDSFSDYKDAYSWDSKHYDY